MDTAEERIRRFRTELDTIGSGGKLCDIQAPDLI
jgi:hypothetical protein